MASDSSAAAATTTTWCRSRSLKQGIPAKVTVTFEAPVHGVQGRQHQDDAQDVDAGLQLGGPLKYGLARLIWYAPKVALCEVNTSTFVDDR